MSIGMSQRHYALHRKVSRQSVVDALRTGRIKLNAAGKIDVAAADKAWMVQRGPRADPKIVELRRSRLAERVLAERAKLADAQIRYCDSRVTSQASLDERLSAVQILEQFADEIPAKINRAIVAEILGPVLFAIENLDCAWAFPEEGSVVEDDLEFESIADLQRILAEVQNAKLVLARKVRSGELVPLKNFVDPMMERANRMRKALFQALYARDRNGAVECVRSAIRVMEQ